MNQNNGQPNFNPNNGGGKRPRSQSYNDSLAGFGSVGPFGQNINPNQNQFAQQFNGYGGYYQEEQFNHPNQNFVNPNFGNPNQNPVNPGMVFPNGNPNMANQGPNMVNQGPPIHHNMGNNSATGFNEPINKNFKGKMENYVPGFGRGAGRRGGGSQSAAASRSKVLMKEPEKIDYADKVEKLKATVKYNITEILKFLEIPPTEEWIKYLEPFAIYVAQQLLVIANRAWKIKPKESADQESALFMTDEEFEKFLSEASFRPPKKEMKKAEVEAPVDKSDLW